MNYRYRVTLVIDVDSTNPYILDIEDEVAPTIRQLQKDNVNIGLAVQYRADRLIEAPDSTHEYPKWIPEDGQWVTSLI